MVQLQLIPRIEFERVWQAPADEFARAELFADMARVNTLAAVKRAGSGHLGSSFSAMDIVTWLYFREMNTPIVGWSSPDRDIYFSSKGHDVPGLYAVLYALGVIPRERFLRLRRLGGLDGHPDVGIPGIEANSGSLGMGISKGKGMAWAKRYGGHSGRVFVLIGDGELQEGQNYEALQSAAQMRLDNLIVIVDHNKVQSDKLVSEIVNLGSLDAKFKAFGWHVARCDGHDLRRFSEVLDAFREVSGPPKLVIADTIKGRGVSFMEHPFALAQTGGLYAWHAGAPDDRAFELGTRELIDRINTRLEEFDLAPLLLENIEPEAGQGAASVMLLGEPVSEAAAARITGKTSDEFVANAFGAALVELGAEHPELIVLDADLSSDCRLRAFEKRFPERFVENGIAEQDMVSTAGGLARQGLLPVVNSFASFLAGRANEQIYNNAGEQTRIIYACHYAGLIPAGPGKSHQSIRDISLLAAIPNLTIVQPCNADETTQLLEYCVKQSRENCMMRLVIGPSPRRIQLPESYRVRVGRGVPLTDGGEGLMFAYGPVMLHEALLAAELLADRGFGLTVLNLPWLNRIELDWLENLVTPFSNLYVLEDHAPVGGLGDHLAQALNSRGLLTTRRLTTLGVKGFPACGTPMEALRFHGLDGLSLATRVLDGLRTSPI